MKSILFLIPTLDGGGAEKVLVNLANNLDKKKYSVTVQTLFKGGVNAAKINDGVEYKAGNIKAFRGNVALFKLFSPKFLYKRIVKKRYDIVVAYLEGVVCRIIAGCPYDSKKIAWIHSTITTKESASYSFRSEKEMNKLYNCFNKIVCVSNSVKTAFKSVVDLNNETLVLYNVNETDNIQQLAKEELGEEELSNCFNIVSVGRLIPLKGFNRLINVHKKLLDNGIQNHLYILGTGWAKNQLISQVESLQVQGTVHFLGFKENPYKYVSNCDLFVCSSISEGLSTAVTEALVLGVPVISTNCSGAYELLGCKDEYGIVVEQSEEELYEACFKILNENKLLSFYKKQAFLRGKSFSKENTIKAIEQMLDGLN